MDHVAERLRKAWQWGSPRRERIRLDEVLAEPIPEAAAEVPFETGTSPWAAIALNAHIALFDIVLVTSVCGYHAPLNAVSSALFIASAVAACLLSLPDARNISRRLLVREAGIAETSMTKSVTAYWDQIDYVAVKSDVSAIRISLASRSYRIDCSTLKAAKRRELIYALRAHLRPYHRDVEELPSRADIWAQATDLIRMTIPIALFVAGAQSLGR